MENLNNKRMEKVQDAVWMFLSSARYYKPNTSVALPMFGTLLYLVKKKCICTVNNVDANDPNIITIINQEYLAILNEDILAEWLEKGIQNEALYSTLPEDDELSEIVKKYLKEIVNLPEPQFIFDTVSTLTKNELSSDDFLYLLDFMMHRINSGGGSNIGQFTRTKAMGELVAKIISPENKSIFNPFSGLMSYAIEIEGYNHFDAIETDQIMWEIGKIRVALAGRNSNVYSKLGDVANWPNKKYDAIVTTPPIGVKITMSDSFINHTEYAESLALKQFEKTTNEKGELYTFVPIRTIASEEEKAIRKHLTENNWLDAVIFMPSGIIEGTTANTALIILKKNRDKNSPVKMIDASSIYDEEGKKHVLNVDEIVNAYKDTYFKYRINVSVQEIKGNHFSWDIILYKDYKREHPESYQEKRLDEIAEIIHGERIFNDTEGRRVRHDTLLEYAGFCKIEYDAIPVENNLSKYVKISEPVILVPTIRKQNPIYCEATKEKPIFVSHSIYTLRIKDNSIHIGYLCYELNEVFKSIERDFRPLYSRDSFMRLKLFIPKTRDEQEQIFNAIKKEALDSKIKEAGLQKYIESKIEDFKDEVSNRKHDMKTPLSSLFNTIILLENLSESLSEETSALLNKYIKRQKTALETLNDILRQLADEEKFAKPEPVNIEKILTSYKTENKNYVIRFQKDDFSFEEAGIKKAIVKIGKSEFKRLTQNIVDNAIKRGFVEDRQDYELIIELSIESGFFIIRFTNNGIPLPEGMDKKHYGMKGVKSIDSDGSGRGGFIVKSIAEFYGGDYDVISSNEENRCLTTIIVKLPINIDENE